MGIREWSLSTVEQKEIGMEEVGKFSNEINYRNERGTTEIELMIWPIIRRECRTQQSALSPSEIERIPGICCMTISLASAQCSMEKCWISIWRTGSKETVVDCSNCTAYQF